MEPLFEFLREYWWLAFPAFGLLSAAAGTWQKAGRDRHKRRLEILRAKAELKAAQDAARQGGRGLPAGIDASPPASTDAVSPLERAMAAHDDVTARWLEYELDVGKTIDFPAMSDGRQPLTAAFLRAKRVADGLRPASPTSQVPPEQVREYRDAVTDYEVAFDVAERDARRLKLSGFTDAERKRLDVAKQLLNTATDTAATPAERQLAYRRVREELDGLLSLSDGAIDVLEKRVARELPSGVADRPDANA
ncbi:hypothetical protein ACFXP7_04560 [Microbacterium sp. P06]|uniref:hypothetical protein n=1 Tax=Microbacterium sp. P06 TaxID=3366949 RepID=UPI0037454799